MPQTGTAYFVREPRVVEDLMRPHLLTDETPYEVVKNVTLGAMDYENFTTDLVADRPFIEENAALCGRGEAWRVLLVQRRGCTGGVLVLPEDKAYVGWAAYLGE